MRYLTLLSVLILLSACEKEPPRRNLQFAKTDLATASLVPLPNSIRSTGSGFPLDRYTIIQTAAQHPELERLAAAMAAKLEARTALQIPVNPTETTRPQSVVQLRLDASIEPDTPEAYELSIRSDSVLLSANSPVGCFRGLQTLYQLIPAASTDTLADHPIYVLPTGFIRDAPRFAYRGTMLDVSRHFFSVAEVKEYIDVLAYYKINHLHLHLSDDQGWRIEIKSWPKLAEVGGKTEVGGGDGGYYTQADYTELVAYAAERFITIVPEIDMPGHTNAASLAYPILNGNGKKIEPYTGTRVGFSTFNTRADTVYAFIDDVVREIAALTPGPYFHIGGDESHVTKKEDYLYFVDRVEKIVRGHGKRMIGWDEVANADLDASSVVQLWNSVENAQLGVRKGMQVLLSPAKRAYLDMQYDTNSVHGLNWAAYIPVDSGYIWDPNNYLPDAQVLGIEAPLWSETVANLDEVEYLAFPRLLGYAEIGWTAPERRNWLEYRRRLAAQGPVLKKMGVDFYPSARVPWVVVR